MNTCKPPSEAMTATEPIKTIQRPQFRITDNENGTTIRIALPGVRKEDLKLTLLEASLRVEATRQDDVPETWKTHRKSEIAGRYALELRLGSRLDGTRTTASLAAGVLTLEVPMREEAKPRQIQVN
ncbi:MAG: Hsp20/alpha crystallin family protein [Luteolibacter sp.]